MAPSLMKNDITTCVDKPDDRKAYSEPCIKRLGRLDEISKQGTGVILEGLQSFPELMYQDAESSVVIGSIMRDPMCRTSNDFSPD